MASLTAVELGADTCVFARTTVWPATGRGGVAIVAVRPGKRHHAHSFTWDSQIGARGSQARLLQRNPLVAFSQAAPATMNPRATLNTPGVSADKPDARVPATVGTGAPPGPVPPLVSYHVENGGVAGQGEST